MSNVVPTKGNLISTKKSLALARTGFDLMDRKRNILVREMMSMIDDANEIRGKINATFAAAYIALQVANVTTGSVQSIAPAVPLDDGFTILRRSVMGVEIPEIKYRAPKNQPEYALLSTGTELDAAYEKFTEVKVLCAKLAQVETSIYRLAHAIKKTQKRVGALKNIIIPGHEQTIALITDALDEKEREEFIRMKVVKRTKEKNS